MTTNDRQPEIRPDEGGEPRAESSEARHAWRPATHHVRVCVLESCDAQRDELTNAIEQRLGIGLDERTADGIALEGLECIGLCGIRHAVLVDDVPVIGRDDVLRAVDE
ncbi:MAG: NAD(P)H-dependent oxidoreductase subunit E, partial [Candidatus Limnocylindrales bacterium]